MALTLTYVSLPLAWKSGTKETDGDVVRFKFFAVVGTGWGELTFLERHCPCSLDSNGPLPWPEANQGRQDEIP